MTREELADALERAIARHDKACADGNVALTTVADAVVKSLIREGLPAILSALRGPAHDEAAVERCLREALTLAVRWLAEFGADSGGSFAADEFVALAALATGSEPDEAIMAVIRARLAQSGAEIAP